MILGNSIERALDAVRASVPRVLTGTVVSDGVVTGVRVVLDNDPTEQAVTATGNLAGAILTGSRVACLAYPPRGLLVLGVLAAQTLSKRIDYDQTSGTFSLTAAEVAGARLLTFELIAGGGGGAGAISTAGNTASGGGGGGGGFGRITVAPSALVFPLQINVGAAGGGGAAGASGGTGGNTNVIGNGGSGTTYAQVQGGVGGNAGANGAAAGFTGAAGAGGGIAGGTLAFDLRAPGDAGSAGFRFSATQSAGGRGGAPGCGGGTTTAPLNNAAGTAGAGFGAGGNGAAAQNGAALAGGTGIRGAAFVTVLY